jgi:hypothetical protein
MQIPEIKHFIPFVVYLAILAVGGTTAWGVVHRVFRGAVYPTPTEAAYFLAGCGVLLWGLH